MKIRKAIISDLEQIAALCSEQFDVMANLQPYLNQKGQQSKEFIVNIITEEQSEIFIVEDMDKIVGFVSVFEKKTSEFSFRVQHNYCYIMDIIVTEKYRGEGIATELMKKTREWSIDRNLEYIELSVLANNPAVKFYEKEMFEETVRTMICRL